jgi:hypothetical protein
MTWLLEPMFHQTIPHARKRELFTAIEDWDSLRAFDAGAFNETDLATGGAP